MHVGGNAAVHACWRQCRGECMLAAMPRCANACWRQCRCVNACWRQCRGEFMLVLTLAAMPLRMYAGGNAAVSACRLQPHVFQSLRRALGSLYSPLDVAPPYCLAYTAECLISIQQRPKTYYVSQSSQIATLCCANVFEIKPDDPEP
jgi:hypothetical protein